MIYSFEQFELDLDRVELRADGVVQPLEPQVFALLALLVENRERLVPREEILEVVWEGRAVTDSALASRIKSARQALGDDGRTQRFIRTARGRGLRFVEQVRIVPERTAVAPAPTVEVQNSATPTPPTNEPTPRPSIAVLPFSPIGHVGRYATLAEGLPAELITELARLRWLFVVARGSSFRLRVGEIDYAEIGRLLGVRYCLTGTVELADKRLVVTAELIDISTGSLVWADRYSGFVDEVHDVRSEIRASIVSALEIQIPLHEAAAARGRTSDDLDAWSAYHLGLRHAYRFNQRDNHIAAELFTRAVNLDPDFARAHAGLSFVHFQNAFMRRSPNIDGEAALARDFAQRAVDLDPLDPFSNFTLGRSYWLEDDLESAQVWVERSTSLSPNFAQGVYARAWTETMAGNYRDGRAHVDLAMKLSPLDPMYYAMAGARAFSHLVRGEDIEGAAWAARAARSPGSHVLMAMIATAADKLAGNDQGARRWADNVRSRNAELTLDDFLIAYPVRAEPMRTRVSTALRELGF